MPAISFNEWLPDEPDIHESPHVLVAENVIPLANHYAPLPGLTATTNSLGGRPLGFTAVRDIDQAVHVYAGASPGDLFELEAAVWTNRSRGGGYTAPLDNTRWRFTPFGDRLIAVNGLDVPQYIDMSTAVATFANLAGAPGAARFCATYLEFVFLGSLQTNAMAIKWSALGDSTGWTAGVGLSDEQEFADGGNLTGFAATKAALFIFHEKCIRRLIFVGGDLIMQIDKIVDGVGCVEPNSLVQFGQRMFFLSEEGWYQFDGESEPQPIGVNRFDKWFLTNSERDSWHKMSTIIDPRNRVFACGFVSSASPIYPDKILFYNYATGRASYATATTEMLVHAQAVATSVDSLVGDLDVDYTISFDDPFWQGGAFYFAAINGYTLHSFSASNLQATLEFGAFPLADGMRASVEWIKPVTDSADATVAGGSQIKPSDAITYQSQVSQQTSGRCPQRGVNGFYFSSKIIIPAASTWTWARGIEFKARIEGFR